MAAIAFPITTISRRPLAGEGQHCADGSFQPFWLASEERLKQQRRREFETHPACAIVENLEWNMWKATHHIGEECSHECGTSGAPCPQFCGRNTDGSDILCCQKTVAAGGCDGTIGGNEYFACVENQDTTAPRGEKKPTPYLEVAKTVREGEL